MPQNVVEDQPGRAPAAAQPEPPVKPEEQTRRTLNGRWDRYRLLALIGLFLAAAAGVLIYLDSARGHLTAAEVRQLKSAEVLEYHGEKLTSAAATPLVSIKGTQRVNISSYRLAISGLVNAPQSLTYDQVLALPEYQKVVTLHCVEGWNATILWGGVRLKDLLAPAGVRPEAKTVIFHAVDGYTSSLPLDYVISRDILLADKMNGVTLMPEHGFPFQVVAEDKWGYKWVKWVDGLELSADENYQGTWEKQGYSRNGDVNGPQLEK